MLDFRILFNFYIIFYVKFFYIFTFKFRTIIIDFVLFSPSLLSSNQSHILQKCSFFINFINIFMFTNKTCIIGSFRFVKLWDRLLEKVNFTRWFLVCQGRGWELVWPGEQPDSYAKRFAWGGLRLGANYVWYFVLFFVTSIYNIWKNARNSQNSETS